MDLLLAAILCALGGCVAGLIGVGGGVIFVPAMTLVLAKGQVEAEATSLLMIALVSVVGTWRQRRYGNVNLRDALMIGLLSPVGVLILYCLLILLASLLGGWVPLLVRLTHRRMELLVSFVSGVMLGVAVLHLLPHAWMQRAEWLQRTGAEPAVGHEEEVPFPPE